MCRKHCTTGGRNSGALELVRIDSRPAQVQPVAESIDDSSLLVSTNDRTFDEPWKCGRLPQSIERCRLTAALALMLTWHLTLVDSMNLAKPLKNTLRLVRPR